MPSLFPGSSVIRNGRERKSRQKKNLYLEEPEAAVYYGPKNDLS